MPILDNVLMMTTPNGRAYLTLLRADVFAVGLVGPSAQISPAERALTRLMSQRATDALRELLECASLPGQFYALLGLSASARPGDPGVEALLAKYRHRTDEVRTQTGCFISSQPIREVVARIEDGTYSGLLYMTTGVGILAFSTSNYAAMLKFFRDFGFTVVEAAPDDQLTPLFEQGRGARINRGDFHFQLEESADPKHRACFNLFLTDFSDEQLQRVQALGYAVKHEPSIYGDLHSIQTPDGGTLVL